jgi:asparagine synthase (glutamine-hydrolysing)
MCGIFAVYNIDHKPVSAAGMLVSSQSIRHRGPDDEGYMMANTSSGEVHTFRGNDSVNYGTGDKNINEISDHNFNLGFAFRRLSIIDLSPAGHQPMCDSERKIWIIFNGEIYNYIELRDELKSFGHNFISGTDTEVIIYAYKQWGEKCFERFNGMWGLVIYDISKKRIICSRDRFGVKPLYIYLHKNKQVIIASELKSIIKYLQLQETVPEINIQLLYDYFLYSLVDHTTETFIKDIHHIQPSTYTEIDINGDVKTHRYFSVEINRDTPVYDRKTEKILCENFKELFFSSVKLRLRTDVPVGSCLSGGLDSSSIVCVINHLLKNNNINKKVIGEHQKTFSAVYDDLCSDESPYIREVVDYTGSDASYIYPSGEMLLSEAERFIYHLDEPFVSTSMYAQWNVMKLARDKGVTVLLDGQGADETLAGYEVYYAFLYSQLLRNKRVSSLCRELMNNFPKGTEILLRGARFYFKSRKQISSETDELKYIDKGFIEKYSGRNVLNYRTSANLQERLYEDLTKYSLPNLLRYEDRNSMAFSIESRTPFLDWRLVKLLMEIPVIYKIHNGRTKWLLRKAMNGRVPDKILQRRDKKGFPTPERKWLQLMKDEITGSIKKNRQVLEGIINTDAVIKDYDLILKHRNIRTNFIWKIYNYVKWKELFGI